MTFMRKVDDASIVNDLSITKLADVMQYCKPKEQFVLVKKFWLQDGKEIPLQQIWNEFGMTRERIRQIENQALMRFRRLIINNDKYLKIIEAAKEILNSNGWLMSWDKLISLVIESKVSDLSWQELKIVLLSDFDITPLTRNRILINCFYIDPLHENLISDIATYIQEYFIKNENPEQNIYSFIDHLKAIYEVKYPDVHFLTSNEFYQNLFEIVSEVASFDGHLWSIRSAKVNPKTIKSKILYVFSVINKPMHYAEMTNKIIEFFPWKPVKISTVHNEMVKSRDVFVNIGLGIYAPKARGFAGGVVKEILIRVMKKLGRAAPIKEITQRVLKEKMVSPNTVLLNLHKYKNLFKKNEQWYYFLTKGTKE